MNSLKYNIQEISSLFKGIKPKRLDLFFKLSFSILSSKTVCLYKTVDEAIKVIPSKNIESCYQKLVNFFCTGLSDLYLDSIFKVIIYLFGGKKGKKEEDKIYLSIDRTTWQIGQRRINLLVIGVVHKNICIPLVWKDLGRKGNSNTKQRLELLDRLLTGWKELSFEVPLLEISGDREFIGDEWLVGLEHRGLDFVLRLKENQQFHVWHKKKLSAKKVNLKSLAKRLQGKQKAWTEIVTESGYIVKLIIIPNTGRNAKKEPFLFLVTNVPEADIQQIQEKFGFRWSIECCFKHLKSNGFHLKEISLEHEHKIHLMLAILTFLYALCIHEGLEKGTKKMKKYANGQSYRVKSVFRSGLSILKEQISSVEELVNLLKRVIIEKWKSNLFLEHKNHIKFIYI
ncbi:MAG: transposase [Saprospiraceae bacterium]